MRQILLNLSETLQLIYNKKHLHTNKLHNVANFVSFYFKDFEVFFN